ncbi:MAG: branched-chain amino acid ABC transporter permease [Deltaproteobacteria bacterium]|nr:branched-chain amino acid ABC transporter permease [Deltaproteobacteria bacterium]
MKWHNWRVPVAFLAAVILLPLVVGSYSTATEIWIFGILAVAFNLLLGYTGLLSFGQATFFGLGAYTSGLLLVHYQPNVFVALAAGALAGGLAALIIGYFCVRGMGGIYFILLTFSFNLMVYFVAYEWTSLTGGEDGLGGVGRPGLSIPLFLFVSLKPHLSYYIFTVVVVLSCYYIIGRIVRSPFGKVLQLIRENETRASAVGYNIRLYKLLAFTVAGLFSGLAGMLYAGLFEYVPIEVVEWSTSGNIVFMTLIGGMGNMIGPLLGAGIFIWLSDSLSVMWDRWPLILGLIFMAVILFFPGGILQIFSRFARSLPTWKASDER